MTTAEIIEIERQNCGKIHLFRSGLFYRAFERSALAFLDVENFKVIKKHSAQLDLDYIYLGFPASIVDRVLEGRNFQKISDDYIIIEARRVSAEELEIKKSGYLLTEQKPPKPRVEISVIEPQLPEIQALYEEEIPYNTRDIAEVFALISAFDIDRSTPLMCQSFLSIIKDKIQISSLT